MQDHNNSHSFGNATPEDPEETRSAYSGSAVMCAFVFALFAVLIGWPLITVADNSEFIFSLYLYLFVVWLAVIVVLYAITKQCRKFMNAADPE